MRPPASLRIPAKPKVNGHARRETLLISFDRKHPSTAIAPTRPVVIDVPSESAETMTAAERREFARCREGYRRTARKSLQAKAEAGGYLAIIQKNRLYRTLANAKGKPCTFEEYCELYEATPRSLAYDLINLHFRYPVVSKIAEKRHLELNEYHYRKLAKIPPEEQSTLDAICARVARALPAPENGKKKQPTGKAFDEAIDIETMDTEEWKDKQRHKAEQAAKAAEAARIRAAHQRQGLDAEDDTEEQPSTSHRAPSTSGNSLQAIFDHITWTQILTDPPKDPEKEPAYWGDGEPPHAPALRGLDAILERFIECHSSQENADAETRWDLKHRLLHFVDRLDSMTPETPVTNGKARRAR